MNQGRNQSECERRNQIKNERRDEDKTTLQERENKKRGTDHKVRVWVGEKEMIATITVARAEEGSRRNYNIRLPEMDTLALPCP